jgi:chaperonin GroEL (HSP60 family)
VHASFANKLSGKEQLAAQKFADALEIIPTILAETSGIEPIDAIVELRALHAKNQIAYGVDALKGKIDDMSKLNILDPMNVKAQAIKSATEAAIMILRIDDIIAASTKKEEKKEAKGKTPSPGEYGGLD